MISERYGRILLNTPLFFRKFRASSGKETIYAADGSSLQFLVEELVSFAASDIAVVAYHHATEYISRLPECLRNRILIIDKNGRTLKQRYSLLAPLAEEFDFEMDLKHGAIAFNKSKLSEELKKDLSHIYFNLHPFLLGLEYELQIDIDIGVLNLAIDRVRKFSRNQDSRAILSILAGILTTYEAEEATAVGIQPNVSERFMKLFDEFVQDETYRRMSQQAHLFGFPDRVQRALELFGRLSRRIVSKPIFKRLVTLTSKGISTATQVPTIDADIFESLVRKWYLPPIVPMRSEIRNARKAWESINPDPFFDDYLMFKLKQESFLEEKLYNDF